METGNTKNSAKKSVGFKSYYVVWKLSQAEALEKKQGLNRTMQYGNWKECEKITKQRTV